MKQRDISRGGSQAWGVCRLGRVSGGSQCLVALCLVAPSVWWLSAGLACTVPACSCSRRRELVPAPPRAVTSVSPLSPRPLPALLPNSHRPLLAVPAAVSTCRVPCACRRCWDGSATSSCPLCLSRPLVQQNCPLGSVPSLSTLCVPAMRTKPCQSPSAPPLLSPCPGRTPRALSLLGLSLPLSPVPCPSCWGQDSTGCSVPLVGLG